MSARTQSMTARTETLGRIAQMYAENPRLSQRLPRSALAARSLRLAEQETDPARRRAAFAAHAAEFMRR